MTTVTDEFMKERLAETKPFTAVILKKTSHYKMPDVFSVIWEHGGRNFSLKAEGVLAIVCSINDGTEASGIGIFTTDEEQTRKIMEEDPGVKAGIFAYEIHPTRSFPGSCLPA